MTRLAESPPGGRHGLCLVGAILAGSKAKSAPPAKPAVGTLSGVDPSFLSALEWRSVGPHRGGRSIAVVGDSKDPLVFYFGSTHGGVWKTEDAGTYWRNVSDGFFKKSPVGAIDVSLSDPAIIYVGMGEALTRQDISPGDGVYKSTDGGKTWAHVGLTETRHIAKVRIHPTNPDIVYVAAAGDIFGTNPDRGVFRTKDGGKTWQKVLFKGDQVERARSGHGPDEPECAVCVAQSVAASSLGPGERRRRQRPLQDHGRRRHVDRHYAPARYAQGNRGKNRPRHLTGAAQPRLGPGRIRRRRTVPIGR